MKIECTVKAGGIPPADFVQTLNKVGAVIDVIAEGEPALARQNWRMQGDSLEEAQSDEVYRADGTPSPSAIEELQSELGGDTVASFGIWGGQVRKEFGASVEVLACGGDFPDTVTINARGAFVDESKDRVAAIVAQAALEFAPAVISAVPKGYEEQQAFDDRPGVGWMLYLPVELTVQQVPEAQELIPVLSLDGKKRLGTIVVSIKDEPFSVDNEEHLVIAHNIEVRLISMDLLPLLGEIG
ncbi:immunity 52 family protein [Burkholderia contaminans]|uniref:Imm52 family immunity protein n=1 Tax=Burkholderia contaminans TaxID=488447 RepID=UPI001CF26B5B|nr:Imm52 family immunity protein [Burkholderia contaminans]MCA7914347.1 immunity 52 family protein [Burkholderia contaminans]UUX41556.1 immunity 52 family protein [Burkholderia contaminans]